MVTFRFSSGSRIMGSCRCGDVLGVQAGLRAIHLTGGLRMLLVAMPGAPSSDALAPSSFLFLVVRPGAPNSVLAPSSCGPSISLAGNKKPGAICFDEKWTHRTHRSP